MNNADDEQVQGFLKIRGSELLWKKRWFVLNQSILKFYSSEDSAKAGDPELGKVDLWQVKDVIVDNADISIRFVDIREGYRDAGFRKPSSVRSKVHRIISMKRVKKDTLMLRAANEELAQRWVKACFSVAFEGQAKQAFDKNRITSLTPMPKTPTSKSPAQLSIAPKVIGLKVEANGKIRCYASNIPSDGMVKLNIGSLHNIPCVIVLEILSGEGELEIAQSPPIHQLSESFSVRIHRGHEHFTVSIEETGTVAPYKMSFSEKMTRLSPVHFAPAVYAVYKVLESQGIMSKIAFLAIVILLYVAYEIHAWYYVEKVYSITNVEYVAPARGSTDETPVVDTDDTDNINMEKDAPGLIDSKELEALAQLREKLKDLLEIEEEKAAIEYADFIKNDFKLIRFLRARKLKVDAAETMFRTALTWRIEYDVRNLRKVYSIPDWLLGYAGSPGYMEMNVKTGPERLDWYFRDRRGHIAVYFRSGGLNWNAVYKKLGNDGEALFRAGAYVLETLQSDADLNYYQSKRSVCPQITIIVDLEGFQMSNQIPVSQTVALARKYLGKVLDAYPEILAHVLIVNAPWLFLSIWKLFKPFFPKEILDKILIYGSRDVEGKIAQLMPEDQIPVSYGGTLQDGDDGYLHHRIPPWGTHQPDRGESYLKMDKTK